MKTGFWRYIGSFATVLAAASLCPVYSAGHAPQIAWTGSHGTNQVRALAFSEDASLLASESQDGVIHLWRANSGAMAGTLTNAGGLPRNLWFRSDSTLLSWSYQEGVLKAWRLSDQSVVSSWPFSPGMAAFSEQGELFARCRLDAYTREFSVWRLGDATPVFTVEFGDYPSFSPDGSELALAFFIKESYRVRLYRTSDWSLRLTLTNQLFTSTAGDSALYSPDGSLLMVRGWGVCPSELWRMPVGEFYGAIADQANNNYLRFKLFSPDGKLIVTANHNLVRFWLVQPGVAYEPWLVYDRGFSEVTSMAISPDGKLIALGLADGRVLALRMPVIIRSAQYEGNDLRLEWLGPSGPYQVQRRESIGAGDWRDYGPPLTEPVVSLPLPGNQAFFRVVGLP